MHGIGKVKTLMVINRVLQVVVARV
jgi:hypothetical protein